MGLDGDHRESEGYQKLEIYQHSRDLALRIHELTLHLPKFELHEEGGQIRRSSKSITNNIVEGYALRKNKNEFLLYLNRSYGSSEETIQHLDFLFHTKSFQDESVFKELKDGYNQLSKMIFRFIQVVSQSHEKPYYIKDDGIEYSPIPNHQSPISLPLSGRSILVTRSREASAEFRALLESHGASVFCIATIDIADPDSWEACDNALWKLAEYDSVCFTSKNAVEKLIQRARLLRPQVLNTLGTRNLYAVGEKTKSVLEATGFSVQPLPPKHSAEELAHSFYHSTIKGRRFLFPKSNIAREVLPDELRALGAAVDEVVVYKTVLPESENFESIRILLAEGKIDIVTFFSPSSFRNFTEMLGTEVLEHTKIAVIGSTTAEAVTEAGLVVAIKAGVSTAEGLVHSIVTYSQMNNP